MALKVPSPINGRGTAPTQWWAVIAAVLSVAVVLVATVIAQGANPGQIRDPGVMVRWGYKVAQPLQNMAAASTIGALVFAAFIVPPVVHGAAGKGAARTSLVLKGSEHPAFTRVMALAAVSSLVWTLSAVAVLLFSFADIAGVPLSGNPDFAAMLASYVTDIATGTAWLWVVIISAIVSTLTFGARSLGALAVTAGLALTGLLPMVLIGHAAGGSDHEQAINSLGLHLVGVCLWLGGLTALVVSGSSLGRDTATVVRRYSTLAGFAFVLVFASGIINALIRIDIPGDLSSDYGRLLLLKTGATVVLGVAGFLHRRWLIPGLESPTGRGRDQRLLWRVIVVELLIMGSVIGLAAVLSRTPPPGGEDLRPALTPAEVFTGYLLPPELTGKEWVTTWRPDWLWIALAVLAAYLYLRAVHSLRREGEPWHYGKILSWVFGLGALVYFTSGGPAVYGRILFSAHILNQFSLTMVVPVLLVLGAPLTLALKVLKPRLDDSRGPREWIVAITESRAWVVATRPGCATALLGVSLMFFYYSDAFGFALREHVGHELMIAYFTGVGCLFAYSMLAKDPIRRRATYDTKMLLLLAVVVAQVVLSTNLRLSSTLLGQGWFEGLGRTWGLAPLADQQVASVIPWAVALSATLLISLVLALRWSHANSGKDSTEDRGRALKEPNGF
ncbi:cytochrome c oxidase assembly protein [Arthrobacter cryoconiti]|uniref:Cytochrome c oxidase assembly protein n=1 Tax=Arthrobacter cryoconiti TaxID=748907 RepID=A0ABV8R4J2_9MICC|nr:cytochrome c oxidase assembly protein [Arthrobacter cryoconiti]MCC9069431.1 bifunctional copper resistance protein CopD/cytochrome c oxidase assembly protein [Arthrobacter cryoconiti]